MLLETAQGTRELSEKVLQQHGWAQTKGGTGYYKHPSFPGNYIFVGPGFVHHENREGNISIPHNSFSNYLRHFHAKQQQRPKRTGLSKFLLGESMNVTKINEMIDDAEEFTLNQSYLKDMFDKAGWETTKTSDFSFTASKMDNLVEIYTYFINSDKTYTYIIQGTLRGRPFRFGGAGFSSRNAMGMDARKSLRQFRVI